MKIVKQSAELLTKLDYESAVRLVEYSGRTCYKSKMSKNLEGAEKFIRNIIKNNHGSVIEHLNLTLHLITDRGVSHELVRHRLASYSQESTRYCVYKDSRFEGEISVINPGFEKGTILYNTWKDSCIDSESAYIHLLDNGVGTDLARSVLPTCLKTEIIVTTNIREWRHILQLRMSSKAHPQFRELAKIILELLQREYPVFFEDIEISK